MSISNRPTHRAELTVTEPLSTGDESNPQGCSHIQSVPLESNYFGKPYLCVSFDRAASWGNLLTEPKLYTRKISDVIGTRMLFQSRGKHRWIQQTQIALVKYPAGLLPTAGEEVLISRYTDKRIVWCHFCIFILLFYKEDFQWREHGSIVHWHGCCPVVFLTTVPGSVSPAHVRINNQPPPPFPFRR